MAKKSFLPSFFTNLYNSVVSPKKEGDSLFYLVQGGAVDMPFKTNFELMRGIPHLNAVVSKLADMFSNVKFYIERTDTEEPERDTKHPLNKVLQNPNKMQNWKQMLYMNSIYKNIGGVSFLYPGFGINNKPSNLAFLTTLDYESYNKVITTAGKPFANDDLDSIIREIQFFFKYQSALSLKPSQLLWFKDSNVNYVDDFTKVTTLIKNLENIYKALVARGVLIDKKGGIGMISGNQKDSGMSVPMTPNEKKKIDKRLNGYGLVNKEPVIITDVPLRWTPMVFPTRELMLFEEITDDFYTICDVYGANRELFANNTTFTNKEQAERATYVNTIVPAWSEFFGLLNHGLNTSLENIKICPDFSHIKLLQDSERELVETQSKKSDMLLKELEKQIITIEEYRQQMGYEN